MTDFWKRTADKPFACNENLLCAQADTTEELLRRPDMPEYLNPPADVLTLMTSYLNDDLVNEERQPGSLR